MKKGSQHSAETIARMSAAQNERQARRRAVLKLPPRPEHRSVARSRDEQGFWVAMATYYRLHGETGAIESFILDMAEIFDLALERVPPLVMDAKALMQANGWLSRERS